MKNFAHSIRSNFPGRITRLTRVVSLLVYIALFFSIVLLLGGLFDYWKSLTEKTFSSTQETQRKIVADAYCSVIASSETVIIYSCRQGQK